MTEAHKEIWVGAGGKWSVPATQAGDMRYVRADIADEHKRQRDLLLVSLGAAVGELQEMVDSAEASGDGSYRWRDSKQAAINSFTAAISECTE